jgi:TetR/AcrR family transcriptional regulator, cholesterol catabolism regulator
MTETDNEKQGVYQHHRDNQIERILEAAEMLFIRDGIEHVSISAIADEARIARKTLYRYFSDRDEIARAIYQKFIETLKFTAPSQPEGTGYQQLEQFASWIMNDLTINQAHQRFLVEFNALYARDVNTDRSYQQISPSGSGAKDGIAQIIQRGMADGSLRTDLDPDKVSAAFLNLIIGMNARFALLGNMISIEYGQREQDIYQEICHIFLRGLQSSS